MTAEKTNTQTEYETNCKIGWTDDEKRLIASVVYPLVEMQKAYGREINAKLVMQGWQAVLSDKYSGEQVVYALGKYALEVGDDFPSPKNLNDILDPKPPSVSITEYKEAKEWQRRNQNFSEYTDAYSTISEFENQRYDQKRNHKIECKMIAEIAQNSIRRLT